MLAAASTSGYNLTVLGLTVFGVLFGGGIVVTVVKWLRGSGAKETEDNRVKKLVLDDPDANPPRPDIRTLSESAMATAKEANETGKETAQKVDLLTTEFRVLKAEFENDHGNSFRDLVEGGLKKINDRLDDLTGKAGT